VLASLPTSPTSRDLRRVTPTVGTILHTATILVILVTTKLMEYDGAARYSMVSIERANLEDVPEIKQVLSETWRATYGSFLSQATINTVTSVWHSPDQLAAEIQNPRIFFGVAKTDDGAIIGLTTVGQIADNTVVLSRLYVHPQYQRQGIGSQLLQAGIAAVATARTIWLEVEENNHYAYTFYHNHGFRETESKEESVEGEVIKVKVMEKLIA
jgi:ribosomal protein S18 acetylase RimI-like enzyme